MKPKDRDHFGQPLLPPKPGSVMWWPRHDTRPQRGLWAPGDYITMCRKCSEYFIGDKRSLYCADCAYDE